MKAIIAGLLLTALLSTGCVNIPEQFLEPQTSAPTPVETRPNTAPVTADEINEKNAAEVGHRLDEEIQKDEKSSRAGTMERAKLAIQ